MVAASWIAPYGNCQTTCGRCPAGCQWPTQPACPCRDVTPPANASSAAGQNCQELVSCPQITELAYELFSAQNSEPASCAIQCSAMLEGSSSSLQPCTATNNNGWDSCSSRDLVEISSVGPDLE